MRTESGTTVLGGISGEGLQKSANTLIANSPSRLVAPAGGKIRVGLDMNRMPSGRNLMYRVGKNREVLQHRGSASPGWDISQQKKG